MRTELENKRIEQIENILDNLSEDELMDIHNEHCNYSNYDDEIFSMCMFDELCEGMSPIDIAQKIFFGDFNPNHNYFRFDGYANFESTDFPSDWIYTGDLAVYIYNNWESYGIDEIADLFDEWESEDEDDEEE